MGFFDKFRKKEAPVCGDDEIVAVVEGEMISPSKITDSVFSKELLGKTIGFLPADGTIVSPVNGKVEVLFPAGHAFAVRMADGTGLMVHVGLETVSLNGRGFKKLVKEGAAVHAGQPVVQVDLETVRAAGLDPVTMLIITECKKQTPEFIEFGPVARGQKILK